MTLEEILQSVTREQDYDVLHLFSRLERYTPYRKKICRNWASEFVKAVEENEEIYKFFIDLFRVYMFSSGIFTKVNPGLDVSEDIKIEDKTINRTEDRTELSDKLKMAASDISWFIFGDIRIPSLLQRIYSDGFENLYISMDNYGPLNKDPFRILNEVEFKEKYLPEKIKASEVKEKFKKLKDKKGLDKTLKNELEGIIFLLDKFIKESWNGEVYLNKKISTELDSILKLKDSSEITQRTNKLIDSYFTKVKFSDLIYKKETKKYGTLYEPKEVIFRPQLPVKREGMKKPYLFATFLSHLLIASYVKVVSDR